MRFRPRFVIGAGLIVAAVAYLIITAIRNTSEYYLTVAEVSARAPELKGQALRVAGRVKAGAINWDPSTLTLKFEIAPIPDAPAADAAAAATVKPVAATELPSYKVICTGQPKPDMFAPGRDVIVEGRLAPGGEIIASQVLTSCPSKYRPKQAK
jgi:cytochrome c-type biogenesis protein CcmE